MKAPDLQRTVPESEIEAVGKLNASCEFELALVAIAALLQRTNDDAQRMCLLFHKVTAGSFLDRPECVESAMRELDSLPDNGATRVLANLIRAEAEDKLGRSELALKILDTILLTVF